MRIQLEVTLTTEQMRADGVAPHILSRGSADAAMYWSAAQIVAHHSANGCNLQPGDLIGTGTLSTDSAGGLGSLLEISQGGKQPVQLATGETRSFLEDGDEVTLTRLVRGRRRRRASASANASAGWSRRLDQAETLRHQPRDAVKPVERGRRNAMRRAISRGAPSRASSSIGRPASTS